MTFIAELWSFLLEGLIFLRNYAFYPSDGVTFSLSRLLSLLIAFSISGAIVVFMSQRAVLKHMGPHAKPFFAYMVASVSGVILAVCSCSILPVFASIRKKGAGIGPAIAFLFSGPAVNLLALTLTVSDLGLSMALTRLMGAILLAIVIGFTMHIVFHHKESRQQDTRVFNRTDDSEIKVQSWKRALFFLTLFMILIFGVYRPIPTLILVVLLMIQVGFFFQKEHIKRWALETWFLTKKIIPLFIIGIFLAGLLNAWIKPDMLSRFVGSNTLSANLLASVTGATMYFATMTEIPIVKTLLANGMHLGPATTLLLAGPTLSLPNMIIISKVLGIKRAFTYIALVIVLSALVGLLVGIWVFS